LHRAAPTPSSPWGPSSLLPTLLWLKERAVPTPLPHGASHLQAGFARLQAPAEFLVHALFGQIRNMAYHPRYRKTAPRPSLIMVLTIRKVRVRQYCISAYCVKCDGLGTESCCRGYNNNRLDKIRICNRPLKNLHPSH